MSDLLRHAPELVEGDEVPGLPWNLLARARRARRRIEAKPGYRWYVMLIVLGGFFSVTATVTIISVAIPRIADDLGASDATVAWALTGPLLASAVLQPTLGKLGDLYGHKRVYVVSFGAQAVVALLVALSWSAPSLIAFRVLGGAVGAAASPTSMALLMDVFDPRERVRALGWWSFVGAGAPVLGVVIGGPVIQTFSWRWIFAAQAPLSVAAVVLGAALLPGRRPESPTRFDLRGSIALTVTVTSPLLAVNRASVWGWASPFVLACLVLFPVAGLAFLSVERRADSPLLPLHFLRVRNFTAPLLVQFFANFAYMGSFLLTPIFLQDVFRFTPTRAGLIVIARPLTFSIAAPVFGYVAAHLGERFNAVAGMSAIIGSMALFSTMRPETSLVIIIIGLALAGFGLGVAHPSLNASVANAVPEEHLGVASASLGMMSTIGGVVGMELMRSVQSFRASAGASPAAAYDQAFLFGGVVGVVALVAAFFVRRLDLSGLEEEE